MREFCLIVAVFELDSKIIVFGQLISQIGQHSLLILFFIKVYISWEKGKKIKI
jgi:hypothetical protein